MNGASTRAVMLLAAAVLTACPWSGAAIASGISAAPCDGVPVTQTPAHRASADPYGSWMRDWLAADWAQLCRYRDQNAALGPASRARVVMMGDSITEGWMPADPAFFGGDVIDRGISGQTTGQMLLRFRSDVIELRPAVVHIMAGTNDIAGNRGPEAIETVQGNLASMVELAQAHGIRVVLAAIPPVRKFYWNTRVEPVATVAAMNAWLREYAQRKGLTWVDYGTVLGDGTGGIKAGFSGDGVHPNAAGYAAMRPLAEAAIARAVAGHEGQSR